MSILSGFLKTKRRRLTDEGYILQSEWTSASTVEFDDGMNAEEKIKDIEKNGLGVDISLADYEDLSEEEKKSGTYWINDSNEPLNDGSRFLKTTDVVDSLDVPDTTAPLSANMGKELNADINDMKIMSDGASKQVSFFRDRPVYEISWKATFEDKTEGYKIITNLFNCTTIELVEVCGSVKHTSGSSAPIGHRVSDNYYSYIYLASDSLRLYHSADMASYMLTIRYQYIQ